MKKKNNKKRALLLGAGGWAREHWIDYVWPDFRKQVEIVGLVDINETVLVDSGRVLGIRSAQLFTNMDEAFNKVRADFCVIVLPPHIHKQAVMQAVDKNMHILSEKPITDKYEDTIAVYKAVTKKHLKMAITQNYRFESRILTLKKILRSGRLGKIDYVISRYASDYRRPGSWDVGSVYEMDSPLLLEGSIHHLDMIRNLSGSNCKSIMGIGWNPQWSYFKGNSSALIIMQMENGVRAVYEGTSSAAGSINRWHQEYYRVECEKGSVEIDKDQIVRVKKRNSKGKLVIEEIPLVPAPPSGHHVILKDFLRWLDGGPAPETNINDNIQSAAMVFAAIEASISGKVKNIADFLP